MAWVPTTWNPADKGGDVSLSAGDLTITATTGGHARSVFAASAGKHYCEFTFGVETTGAAVGVANASADLMWPGVNTNGVMYDCDTGYVLSDGTTLATGGSNPTVLGLLLDADTRKFKLTLDGVDYGTEISIGFSGSIYVAGGCSSGETSSFTANFGASSFAYPVPSGYEAGFGDTTTALIPNSVLAGVVPPPRLVRGNNPTVIEPSSTTACFVGAPTALPYRNSVIHPYSLAPVKFGDPALLYTPVFPVGKMAVAGPVLAGVVGQPTAKQSVSIQPGSVVCGEVGVPSANLVAKAGSTLAAFVGTPVAGQRIKPNPTVAWSIGVPAMGCVMKPASLVAGSVGAPSASSQSTISPASTVAGIVGSPRFSGVTIRPFSVVVRNGVGKPSFAMGATC